MLNGQIYTSNLSTYFKGRFDPGKTSTPIRYDKMQNFQKGNKEISPVVVVEKKEKLIVLIIKAIKAVGHPRKGASYQAIKKWIIDLKGNESNNFNRMLKLAVFKAISTGDITRPRHCLTAVGAVGSFILPKVSKEAPKKAVKQLQITSTPKAKGKKIIEKKIVKAAGKKVPAKPSVVLPSKKQNLVFSSSDSEENNKKSPDEIKSKPRIKSAAKEPSKQKSKGKSKMDPSETKKSTRVKKKENAQKNDEKEENSTENSREKVKKGENVKEITAKEKLTKKKIGGSEKLDKNKKENAKTVIERTIKVPRNKLPTTTDVPLKRKECSDTELDVNIHRSMPLKSHSSDTELEISKREKINNKKNIKTRERKMPAKKIEKIAGIK